MKIKRRNKGLDFLKERYGIMFISPWIIGMAVFFIVPVFQSFYYGFSSLSLDESGLKVVYKGLVNYTNILREDPSYLDNFFAGFSNIAISLPFILIVSIVAAFLLNGKYFGRIFFRGAYFLPVIITGGAVFELFLQAGSGNATSTAVSETVSFASIDFEEVLAGLNLPPTVYTYLSDALNNIFMLVWQSGVQTILIIAGLQSIPDLLYEVAKVEGATKWEELWFITLPMLTRTLFLVVIYTLVEIVSASDNGVITSAYTQFENMEYGLGSAMLWFYYIFVGLLFALLYLFYTKVLLKKSGDA